MRASLQGAFEVCGSGKRAGRVTRSSDAAPEACVA
jgi:hypothetical protein